MELKLITKYFGVIGLIIFIYIILKLNLDKTIEILKNIHLGLLFFSFLVLFLLTLLGSLRWRYIVNKMNINLSVKDSILINLKSLFSEYSPGKIGFLIVTSIYLKEKTKENWEKIIFSTVFNKFIEVWFTSIEALIGIIVLIFIFKINSSIILPIGIMLIIIIASFIFFKNDRIMKKILRPFFKVVVPKKEQLNFNDKFDKFYNNTKNVNLRIIFVSFIYQLIILIMAGLSFYLLGLAIGINLPFYLAIIAEPFIAFATILPISFSGLGTREAAVAFLFSLIGISLESALIFSLLVFLLRNLLILIGLILIPLERLARGPSKIIQ